MAETWKEVFETVKGYTFDHEEADRFNTPKNIRRVRESFGFGSTLFARYIGCKPFDVLLWEKGEKECPRGTIRLIYLLDKHPELMDDLMNEVDGI